MLAQLFDRNLNRFEESFCGILGILLNQITDTDAGCLPVLWAE